MKDINVLGIDLAKSSFQLHGLDEKGNTVFKKAMSPKKADEFIANLKPCRIGMEACGGAHFQARKYISWGHDAKIIAPQFVKSFVKGNRNDISDAEGIAEAASRPSMRFVPVKTEASQDLQNYHRIRERLIHDRIALSNQIRGILFEYGIKIPKGNGALKRALGELGEKPISDILKRQMSDLHEELIGLEERCYQIKKEIEAIAESSETCQRLMEIPGVGPIVATAIHASVPDAREFHNGRQMAAWLGLVPGHRQTGGPRGKVVMLPITKRGDRYLRKVIVQGARGFLTNCRNKEDSTSLWVNSLREKKGYNTAAVALANKNARTICAVLKTGEYIKKSA